MTRNTVGAQALTEYLAALAAIFGLACLANGVSLLATGRDFSDAIKVRLEATQQRLRLPVP